MVVLLRWPCRGNLHRWAAGNRVWPSGSCRGSIRWSIPYRHRVRVPFRQKGFGSVTSWMGNISGPTGRNGSEACDLDCNDYRCSCVHVAEYRTMKIPNSGSTRIGRSYGFASEIYRIAPENSDLPASVVVKQWATDGIAGTRE